MSDLTDKKDPLESQSQEEPAPANQLPEDPPGNLPFAIQEAVANTTSVAGTALFWSVLSIPLLIALGGGYFVFGWGVVLVLGGILAGSAALMRNPPLGRSGRGSGTPPG